MKLGELGASIRTAVSFQEMRTLAKKKDLEEEVITDPLPDTSKKPSGTMETKKACDAAEKASREASLKPSLSGHRFAARLHSLAADHHGGIGNSNQEAYHRKLAEHHVTVASGFAQKSESK
jgi:hypothetical protein